MGLLDRRPVARPLVRHRRIRRPVRAQRRAVPQLGDAGRQPRPVRRGRLQGRAGALPSLRLARLPVGAPDADLPQAQGAGGDDRRLGGALADGASMAGPSSRRPGATGDRLYGHRYLHELYARADAALYRPGDRAGAVGPGAADDRQQRVVRDHPHAELGVRRHRRRYPATTTRQPLRGRDRRGQRARLRHRQQRRLPGRVRHHAGGLRGGGRRAVRDARLARGAAGRASATLSATG